MSRCWRAKFRIVRLLLDCRLPRLATQVFMYEWGGDSRAVSRRVRLLLDNLFNGAGWGRSVQNRTVRLLADFSHCRFILCWLRHMGPGCLGGLTDNDFSICGWTMLDGCRISFLIQLLTPSAVGDTGAEQSRRLVVGQWASRFAHSVGKEDETKQTTCPSESAGRAATDRPRLT